jgi:hypothetical protein
MTKIKHIGEPGLTNKKAAAVKRAALVSALKPFRLAWLTESVYRTAVSGLQSTFWPWHTLVA